MKFFLMEQPQTDSDYADIWINGLAQAKHGLPGVQCSVCGETRTWLSGVRPQRLPDDLLSEHDFTDLRPVPDPEYRALRKKVEAALRAGDPDIGPLEGGETFTPLKWSLPSRPDGDVFWAMLGSPIVSGRAALALQASGASGFSLIPVETVRHGTRPASDEPPIPESGEPEDLCDLAQVAPDGGEFFLLSITGEGNPGAGMHIQPACPGCGNVEIEREDGWDLWDDSIWAGADMFHYPSTRYAIVTERIAGLFADLGAGNVDFRRLAPGHTVDLSHVPELPPVEPLVTPPPAAQSPPGYVAKRYQPAVRCENDDVDRIAKLLSRKGFSVDRFPEDGRTPDLTVTDSGGEVAYFAIRSIWPGPVQHSIDHAPRLIGRLLGALSDRSLVQGRFDAIAACVHDAVLLFESVNPDLDLANVLILVDHGSGATSSDLYDVNTARDGAAYGMLRGEPDAQTKGEKLRIDLQLWMNAQNDHTEHLHLPLRGGVKREIFFERLYDLGAP